MSSNCSCSSMSASCVFILESLSLVLVYPFRATVVSIVKQIPGKLGTTFVSHSESPEDV